MNPLLLTPGFGHLDTKQEIKPSKLINDMKPICGIANGIEGLDNPYEAADKAVRFSRKYRISKYLFELDAEIQKGTLSDRRFKGMEHEVALGVEREINIALRCSTPRCTNPAIKNSHTLQKGGILKYLSNDIGKVYQTKITPFTQGDGLKELNLKSASTFPGFCKSCEISEFSHVETSDVALSFESALPLIWRSLCYIRFRRAQELKIRGLMVSKPDLYELVSEHEDPASGLATMLNFKNSIFSYRMARKWTAVLEAAFKNGGQISMIAVKAPNIPFAGAGIIPIPIDFKRELDSNIFRFDREISSLAYTTILIEGIPIFVFVARNMDARAKLFCKSMVSMDPTLLSAYFPQIVIGGSDTVFVSKTYWDDQASPADKKIFAHAQAMKFPQMAFPSWGGMTNVKIDSVLRV